MRRVSTRVFPDPAPATIASGAASMVTARRCASSRSANRSRIGSMLGRGVHAPWCRSAAGVVTLSRMPYPRSQLNSYEEIAIDLHPHWIYFVQSAVGLLAALVVTYFVKFGPNFLDHDSVVLVCVFAILACAVWLGITYLRWVTTNFVVTTDRVIFRVGVFARHGVEIPLERI